MLGLGGNIASDSPKWTYGSNDSDKEILSMRSCAVCGNREATPWTLLHKQETTVINLCEEHAKPLAEVVELAKSQPGGSELPSIVRKPRKRLEPLDWTPPS